MILRLGKNRGCRYNQLKYFSQAGVTRSPIKSWLRALCVACRQSLRELHEYVAQSMRHLLCLDCPADASRLALSSSSITHQIRRIKMLVACRFRAKCRQTISYARLQLIIADFATTRRSILLPSARLPAWRRLHRREAARQWRRSLRKPAQFGWCQRHFMR